MYLRGEALAVFFQNLAAVGSFVGRTRLLQQLRAYLSQYASISNDRPLNRKLMIYTFIV